MEKDCYRAAVVGLGFIGAADQVSGDAIGQRVENLRGTHAQSLMRHARVRLVAGASRDLGRRERFSARTGVTRTYERWRDMLEREQLDIVSVATNSPHHAEVVLACARRGVRCVFCEKPIATSLRDADAMIEACAAAGTILVVNHTRRWEPLFRDAAAAVLQGALGQVHHVLARWPAGRLGNVGTHLFDALDLLLGKEPRQLVGMLDDTGRPDCRGPQFHDPGGWGILIYEDGCKVFIDASESINSPVPMSVLISGSRGELGIDGYRGWKRAWGHDPVQLPTPTGELTAMDRAVDEIVRCLDTGAPSSSPGEAARRALEIVMAFHVCSPGSPLVRLPLGGAARSLSIRIG